jgi:CheY-like chemotaxis protein
VHEALTAADDSLKPHNQRPRDFPSSAVPSHSLSSSQVGCVRWQIPRRARMPDRLNGGDFVIRPRIFLADDHADFLKAEIALLQPHFELVGIASDGASLVSEVQRLKPDVVVVDITMPIMTGIDAVHELVKSGSTAKFVFLTIHSGEEFIKACLEEGARGYVVKSQMKAHLIPAIRAALDGLPYIPASVST